MSDQLQRPDWLDEFERKTGRPLRVLHVGNIANNAFINAKLMRKIGVHADVVCADYYHIMGTPEWEEAEFKGDYGDPYFPDWWRAVRGYLRPSWFFQGPRRLCQDTMRAQFEQPAAFQKKVATLKLATDYVAYRESKLAKVEHTPWKIRFRRRADFAWHLAKLTWKHPDVGWAALTELFPFLQLVSAIVRVVGIGILLMATILVRSINRALALVSGRRLRLALRSDTRIAELRWRVRDLLVRRALRTVVPTGSRMFRLVTRRNFSEVTGMPFVEWIRSGPRGKAVMQVPRQLLNQRNQNVQKIEPARYIEEVEKYLVRTRQHARWGAAHREWHARLDDKAYVEDVALANALAAGWEEVFAHYDVVQCYSTDGISPMALGRNNYFDYEHGTLRAIPFEDTQIGRLTATSYRLATGVMLTNLDNYVSCEKLGIPDARIVPLPHAMDDEKIHRFVAARPHIRPSSSEPPLFFSSARQHWLDTDPNYAKGNDIFFRAAARVREAGHPLRLMLVRWGRDLEASDDLLADLKLTESVTWVPTMTGEELWERYLAAHAVVDQFIIPAFGRVTFDSLTIGRRVISNLDIPLARRFFGEAPPMMVASTVDEAEQAALKVVRDPQDVAGIGIASAQWARRYHSSQRIIDLQMSAYKPTLPAMEQA